MTVRAVVGEGRQVALHLLQPLLPRLLRRRGRCADGRGLGADALRHGHNCLGRRARRPRVRRDVVPELASAGQGHLYSCCKGESEETTSKFTLQKEKNNVG
jgi:hypothetical protein